MRELIINSKKYGEKKVIIDDEDYDYLMQWKWHLKKGRHTFYAVRHEKDKRIYLHRFLLHVNKRSTEVDHKDRDGLHNFRSNLRIATRSQNGANSVKYKNCTSEFKGVVWNKPNNKWISYIHINRKYLYLGSFKNEREAAEHYNIKALEVHGEFAYLNEIN